MKILVITDLFPTTSDPTKGIFIFQWVKHLAEHVDISVFQIVWGSKNAVINETETKKLHKTITEHEQKFTWMQEERKYFLIDRLWIRTLQFYHSIKKNKLLSINRFDMIIGQMGCPGGYVASRLGKKYHIPSIVGVRGSDATSYLNTSILKYFSKWTYENCDHIVTVSNSLKEKLKSHGINEKKVTTIHNGINPIFKIIDRKSARQNLGLSISKKIILFVGHLIKIKGVDYLIKAITKINAPNIYLYIIGEGEKKEELLKQVKILNIEKRVFFIESAMPEELLFCYNAADVFCLPSLREGIPNVVLESLACGTPVITTDISDNATIIHSNNGFLVNPKNSEELSEAIKKSLNKKWNRNIIRTSIEKFSWNTNINNWLKILTKHYGHKRETKR